MRTSARTLLVCGLLVSGLPGCLGDSPALPGAGGAGGEDEPQGGSGGSGGTAGMSGAGGRAGTGGGAGKGGSPGTPDAAPPVSTPDADVSTPTPDAGASPDASGSTDGPPATPMGMGSFPGCPGCKAIFDGMSLTGWHAVAEKYDVFMDPILKKNVMRSTGASRGFLATDKSYQNFRLIYSNRLLGGGHAQNMLIWCMRDAAGKYPNNACGGVQYQPPGRSMWDYRPGQNKSPAGKTSVGTGSGASSMDWSQCEMIVKGTTGEFKVACCKLTPGAGPCKGIEILRFKDVVGGEHNGPIAWQAHNGGHVIHWTDVHLEENPTSEDFVTMK